MASAVNLDYLPAVKMLLHAAKHPASAVNGLLVCRQQDALKMNIVDYVPLFHSPLTLTPMLETALYQIESYCTMAQLRICGYFQANEHLHDNTPTPFAYKIAEKLNEKSDPACLIMLKNDRLHPAEAGHFAVYSLSQGKWQETKYTVAPETADRLNLSLQQKLARRLYDFDDHLNDVTHDYLNTELSNLINVSVCE
ncbi:hypothetical protein CRM22_008005 [Opisthorchis felineus]|uniref:MPN domain-containing protein n=1 Tax=Opisthorchis felineus TaxID=147828 RepID=A0A4S2LL60_OPIFE|nr:hypothetical protein CRM22_008005 [Opisthorchis felineus]